MTDLLGQLVGNYQLEALLAIGPTGPTYSARHVQLRRLCTVKVFDPGLTADPAVRARLLESLQRVAGLRHPNLLTVYDLGEVQGRVFVASEAPAGGTLRSLLQQLRGTRARLTIARALDLARQCAEGLDHAHRAGIVHGALRPEALRLSSVGEEATLKVGDLGIAPVLPVEATAMPAYLTPEQARSGPPDARSDVYGLGTLLYELLIGVPPFNLSDLDRATEKHLRARPVPPRVVRPEIPAALETIVLRCLAKAPEERFAHAGDLAEALRQVAGAPASTAPPPPAPEPLLSSLLETPPPPPSVPAGPLVSLTPERERIELTPGRPTVVAAQIHHRGPGVERFSLSLEGVPAEWISAVDPPVELGPDARARLTLLITAPTDHRHAAGEYPALLRARAATAPEREATARIVCSVRPFVAPHIVITPERASGRMEGEYSLTIRNDGNTEATFALSADDPRRLLAYEFVQESVRLAPGQSARVPLTVLAPRRLFGGPETLRFSVFAESEEASPVEARAEFTRVPLLPLWAPLAAAGLIALALLAGLLLNNPPGGNPPPPATATIAPSPQPGAPQIAYFTVKPEVVAPGEPVTVAWDVRGAERVQIDQFGDVPPLGERSFRPERTTDFRLVARAGDKETVAIVRVLVAEATPTPEPTAIPTEAPSPAPAPSPTLAATATPVGTATPAAPTPTLAPAPGSIALLDLAPAARWTTSAGPITFGAPQGNPEAGGWADIARVIRLEDGSLAPAALLTFPPLAPEAAGDGRTFIEARFDLPQIQAGQFFLAVIGFSREARGPALDVLVTFNNELLYEGSVLPDGALTAISADMAPFVGQEGDLVLRVSAEQGAAQALYWVKPRIDRP
ncbi:MAG: protein kinase [Oscillochloridaceae bacterium]|nr:protein kinase [Chloroflexaceae bacterium]MDW8391377.1 protein kinase [Oscillochloridaceae bacterium]